MRKVSMMAANRALGDFLRTRRERLSPAALGLPVGRRRTPGLRRDEVAASAGISAEWYVKLEQGRAVAPSVTTVDALARALHLDTVEHAHLRRLARTDAPGRFEREKVPATIRAMVEGLPYPAYVTGLRWDVLVWNAAACAVLGDMGDIAAEQRNILLFMLTTPRAQTLFGEQWSVEARRMLALFRATYDVWALDPAFTDLVTRLRVGCPQFEAWWQDHEVGIPSAGVKTLHTRDGVKRFAYTTFQANDDPALKLVVYLPATP